MHMLIRIDMPESDQTETNRRVRLSVTRIWLGKLLYSVTDQTTERITNNFTTLDNDRNIGLKQTFACFRQNPKCSKYIFSIIIFIVRYKLGCCPTNPKLHLMKLSVLLYIGVERHFTNSNSIMGLSFECWNPKCLVFFIKRTFLLTWNTFPVLYRAEFARYPFLLHIWFKTGPVPFLSALYHR